jgi:hypothetical protein
MMRPVRRAFLATAVLVSVLLSAAAAHPADRFVGGIGDLPLMPGLAENPNAGMVFDTPSGRIVQTEATGRVSRDQVLSFYAETLPQLGWRTLAAGQFRREAEVLKIEIDETGEPDITVRFALSPASAGNKP